MKKKVGIIFIIVGLIIIVSSVVAHCHNMNVDKQAEENAQQTLVRLKNVMQTTLVREEPEIPEEPEVTEEPEEPEEPRVIEKEMPVIEIDGMEYIGYISIPKIEIELAIAAELNDDLLLLAPCRYVGSAYMNNLVVAAHNFVSNFGELKTLSDGDEVTLTDVNGNVFRYEVKAVEKLSATSVDKMINSEYDFTLFTCTKGGKFRIALRCSEIDDNKYVS